MKPIEQRQPTDHAADFDSIEQFLQVLRTHSEYLRSLQAGLIEMDLPPDEDWG